MSLKPFMADGFFDSPKVKILYTLDVSPPAQPDTCEGKIILAA